MAYNGAFSQGILIDLGMALEGKTDNPSLLFSKRLFSIFIEMTQNILIHSAERTFSKRDGKEIGHGIVLVRNILSPVGVEIISGNKIKREDGERVQERCLKIAGMNSDELKEFYKSQRAKPHEQKKSGGNIGLIDIARRSGNAPEISLTPVDKQHYFMTLGVKLYDE